MNNPSIAVQAGQEEENEGLPGIYYAGARYYNSAMGIWYSGDPAGQFVSPYRYANNPLMMVDPDGEFFQVLLIGAAMGGFQGLMHADNEGIPWYQRLVKGPGIGMVSSAAGFGASSAMSSMFNVTGALAGAATGAVAGGISGGISGGLSSKFSGGDFWSGFESGAKIGGITGGVMGGLQGYSHAKSLGLNPWIGNMVEHEIGPLYHLPQSLDQESKELLRSWGQSDYINELDQYVMDVRAEIFRNENINGDCKAFFDFVDDGIYNTSYNKYLAHMQYDGRLFNNEHVNLHLEPESGVNMFYIGSSTAGNPAHTGFFKSGNQSYLHYNPTLFRGTTSEFMSRQLPRISSGNWDPIRYIRIQIIF